MMTVLSLLPIITLLLCLIVVRVSVALAGGISLATALVIAMGFFGLNLYGLSVAAGKALSLALFVSLIVWSALFLYHLAADFRAVEVINKNIVLFIQDKFVVFLLLTWLFSGLLQGMAGFGVPIVIAAPILIALGFDKVKSLAAVLLGHSWAVTFGSMGASFFIIQMITGIPPQDLGFPMWIFNSSLHLMTGFGVCWLYDGIRGIKKGLGYIFPVSAVIGGVQYLTISGGFYPLATLIPALAGLAAMFLLYKLRAKPKAPGGFYSGPLTLRQAVLPYAVVLGLSLLFQLLPPAAREISLSFSFPAFQTALEYPVQAETGYARIRLFGHPVVKLLCAAVVAIVIYRRAGIWEPSVFRGAVKKTVKKGIPATLALLALGTMSLVMMDSGMTHRLAYTVAALTGSAYPVFAPFFGVLASFLTGNNTNSNVLFGSFQYTIAQRLGVSGAVMSAAQSLSGALGVSLSPTLVLMGAIATKQDGQESLIYRKLIGIVLLIAFVMGLINLLLVRVW